jgi:hypothetical protein
MVRLKMRILYLLPIIQLLWINVHIFFIFGFFTISIFCLYFLLMNDRSKFRQLALIAGLSVVASLVNPFGFRSFIEPFHIFREYGYMIAENQSVIFMQKRFPGNPVYPYYEFLFGLCLLMVVFIFIKKQTIHILPQLIIAIVFAAFAWKMVRGLAFFGFVSIPLLASIADHVYHSTNKNTGKVINWGSLAMFLGIAILMIARSPLFFPHVQVFGLGLMPRSNESAIFFRHNNLHGPVFNNYDIGSYLIFQLFPKEKVFTDNRPEAYSVSFFRDIYVPMQENDLKWKEFSGKYNINVIYFYRHDLTPWGQPFLIRRIRDPEWAPVYVDDYTLILVKRNSENQPVVRKFELPQSLFSVTQ